MRHRPPKTTRAAPRFPYTTLVRSDGSPGECRLQDRWRARRLAAHAALLRHEQRPLRRTRAGLPAVLDLARPEDGPQRQHGLLGRFRLRSRGRSRRERALRLDPVLGARSEEHTSELQSLMRISYDVFCLKKKNKPQLPPIIRIEYNTIL